MKKKNTFLELLRFVFCMIIFFHHSGFLVSEGEAYPFKAAGFYAVEFFFILTGAFSVKHIRELKNSQRRVGDKSKFDDGIMKYSLNYTISKLKRIFPYALCGIIMSYGWYFLEADYSKSLKDIVFGSWNILYEALFLPMTGIMNVDLNVYLNSPLWYLSVILIALPVIIYLAVRFEDVFDNYLCIFLPLLLHGYLINIYGSVGSFGTYNGIFYTGVIRGFADILLGCFAYKLSGIIKEKIKDKNIYLTVFELVSYVFVIYTFNTSVDGYTYEFAILLLAVAISISLSEKTYTSLLDGKVFNHLGKLSVPIYCIHWPLYKFVSEFSKGQTYVLRFVLVLALCICISEGMIYLVDRKKYKLKEK